MFGRTLELDSVGGRQTEILTPNPRDRGHLFEAVPMADFFNDVLEAHAYALRVQASHCADVYDERRLVDFAIPAPSSWIGAARPIVC